VHWIENVYYLVNPICYLVADISVVLQTSFAGNNAGLKKAAVKAAPVRVSTIANYNCDVCNYRRLDGDLYAQCAAFL
jgi:hypothetical protein